MKPYKQMSRSIIYKNPYWRYCLDQVEFPSGKSGEYHLVLTNGSAMTVPVAEDGTLLMVRQYRYTGKRDSIEFPCGGLKDGASFDETARHELMEETGYMPEDIALVGSFNPCNGLLDEICRVYIARNLRYVGAHPDETESFELVRLTIGELDAYIRDGTIWDGITRAAWVIAGPKIL